MEPTTTPSAPPKDLASSYTRLLREQNRDRDAFRCCECGRAAATEPKFWAHFVDDHQLLLPLDSSLFRNFRAAKAQASVTARFSGRLQDATSTSLQNGPPSPAASNQQEMIWAAPLTRSPTSKPQFATPGSPACSTEIATGAETTHSGEQLQNTQESISALKLEQRDVEMPDALGKHSVAPSRGRRTRAPAPRKSQGLGRGRRPENIDPDFDRSRIVFVKTEEENSPTVTPTRRLFDPSHDNANTFQPLVKEPETMFRQGNSREERGAFRPPPRTSTHPAARPQSRPQRRDTHQPRRDSRSGLVHPKTIMQPVAQETPRVQILANPQQLAPAPDVPMAETPSINDNEMEPPPEDQITMVRQPDTRPISHEQLVAEVRGIYAGLIMVEAKCCEVDTKQHQLAMEHLNHPKLTDEQWQALIALHRTLLHEHHDFFLASQHPSANDSLKKLAQRYMVPARMWRHGIHTFLELLRHRLPDSREHMLTFIYLAYSMMALLYETVPAYEDTWIECLGDLARYRMAIEENDLSMREVWQNVARMWYSKAADKSPYTGRLYHHLAILARGQILEQLFYYCKSLTVGHAFSSARESILTVFDPTFASSPEIAKPHPVEAAFVGLHSITFSHIDVDKFPDALDSFQGSLDRWMGKPNYPWKVSGCHMAVCNIAALYQYGSRESLLKKAWKEGRREDEEKPKEPDAQPDAGADELLPPLMDSDVLPEDNAAEVQLPVSQPEPEITKIQATVSLEFAMRLGFTVLSLMFEREDDPNVLPHVHCWIAFVFHIINSAPAIRLLEQEFPWQELVEFLNSLAGRCESEFNRQEFPSGPRPLPEDFTLQGLQWTRNYLQQEYFDENQVDAEERPIELPSMTDQRIERILWLAVRISTHGDWIKYSSSKRDFTVHPALVERIELRDAERLAEEERQKLAAARIPEAVDEDVEMTAVAFSNSEDEGYVLVQTDEMRALKARQRDLQAQLQAANTITKDSYVEASRSLPSDALKPGYTCFVVDTNLLVKHIDVFQLILEKKWQVVIPNAVLTELHGLSRNNGPVGEAATSARRAIDEAVSKKLSVRIITAKGSDVTTRGFFRERLDRDPDDEEHNLDDVIVKITKMLQDKGRSEKSTSAEPVLLVTEDANMRVKANSRSIPAIGTTVLKRFIAAPVSASVATSPRRAQRAAADPAKPKGKFNPALESANVRIVDPDAPEDTIMPDVPSIPYIQKQPVRQQRGPNKRGRQEVK